MALSARPASARSDAPQWTYVADEHFEVYTTAGDAVARQVLDDCDLVHSYYEQLLHTTTVPGPRTRVIVFGEHSDFAPYAPHAAVRAFYQSSLDGDFIALAWLGGDAFPALAHEYAHLFFRRSGSPYPLWLADGLAEYFSTLTPQNGRLKVGSAPPERAKALGFGVRLMPLERLFAITRESADYTVPSRTSLFFAQSWALAHLLVTDERYRDRSAAYFARLAANEPAALAFQNVYGRNLDELSKDLSRYALRGNYKTTTTELPVRSATAASTPRPATDLEAGVVLASMLGANTERQARARAAFAALERLDANDLRLIEAEAMFAVRNDQFDEARPYLDRAIAAQSNNARIYLYAAAARRATRSATEDGPTEEETLMAKALDLAPGDTEVRIAIARALVADRRGADALAMLAPLTRVALEYTRVLDDTRTAAQKLIRFDAGR